MDSEVGIQESTHGFQYGFGVFGGDLEEHAGGAGGLAAALLPVAQGGRADAESGAGFGSQAPSQLDL